MLMAGKFSGTFFFVKLLTKTRVRGKRLDRSNTNLGYRTVILQKNVITGIYQILSLGRYSMRGDSRPTIIILLIKRT